MNIKNNLITLNPFSRPGTKLVAKRGIVMHYTADSGATASNIGRYFDSLKNQNLADKNARYASAQFSVDRNGAEMHIPPDEMAYNCGSSQPYLPDAISMLGSYPNNSTVGIEMCIELDGSIHEDTFQNAADLVVHLIQNEGFPEVLFTHKGVVGWKDCPLLWVKSPNEFERFKQVVKIKLKEDEVMKAELAALTNRVEELEAKTKVLEKTSAPKWFIDEFGMDEIQTFLKDATGDYDFWRNLAITIRFIQAKK
jgi:N-acetylmuramoyl-L-alanine amidase